MSVITDLVLYASFDEADAVARLNDWLSKKKDFPVEMGLLRQVPADEDGAYRTGGNKVFCSRLWASSINHLAHWDLDVEVMTSFGWVDPASVVLILQTEDGAAEVVRPAFTEATGWGGW